MGRDFTKIEKTALHSRGGIRMKMRDLMLCLMGICGLAVLRMAGSLPGGDNPVTGDTTVLWPAIALLALSGAGIVIMLILKKKTRK
jgi:hypothetical protein